MELWDILDSNGVRTGRTIERGQTLRLGDFHLAVHTWIRDQQGDYLIQQRALHLTSGPGIWATTVGHVVAGEESIYAARRETIEELGLAIPMEKFERIGRVTTRQLIQDIYLVQVTTKSTYHPRPGAEVNAVQWASQSEIEQMIHHGQFFAYSYLYDFILSNTAKNTQRK